MSEVLSSEDYSGGVLAGDRRTVSKAITLLESRREDHRELGQQILDRLVPHTGNAIRVGVTGPPGVGKSTFVETLGLELIGREHRVAVLAVDPSSPVSGGSILGDKTRMERLSREPAAYIRPTPSGGTLGGVAHRTREAMLVCEAAGFDVVLVETVGVGQSEAEVRSMVDFFAVLLQPGAGDELQGIKRGVLELADGLFVNKADGEYLAAAERTRAEHERALSLLRPGAARWSPPVRAVSSLRGTGIREAWQIVLDHREIMDSSGELQSRRCSQARAWLQRLLEDGLKAAFQLHPEVAARIEGLGQQVEAQVVSAPRAARLLLDAFQGR